MFDDGIDSSKIFLRAWIALVYGRQLIYVKHIYNFRIYYPNLQ